MNYEKKLLAAAIHDRKVWTLVSKHLGDSEFTEPGRRIFETITAYYTRDPEAASCDLETLTNLVLQSATNPKHKETFKAIMDGLAAVKVSGVNVVSEILGAKRESVAARLSTALAAGEEYSTVQPLLSEYDRLSTADSLEEDKESELLVAPGPEVIFGGGDEGQKVLKMYPKALNDRLRGGMLAGHHVVVFARPEMGKTAFLVNLTAGFLRQKLKVLYLCNEEPVEDLALRMVNRLSLRTYDEVMASPKEAYELAMKKGYGNLYMKRLSPGTVREIEQLVSEVKPDVLIVDQLRHIKTKEENKTQQLEQAANGVRTIVGRHKCLGISVTQAGDSASGKAVLDMGDVDSSNTGIPGTADLMIGIGANKDDEASNRRVLSLCKNKRSGNHEFFPVRIQPELSKYLSVE